MPPQPLRGDNLPLKNARSHLLSHDLAAACHRPFGKEIGQPQLRVDHAFRQGFPRSDISTCHTYLDLLAAIASQRLSTRGIGLSVHLNHEQGNTSRATNPAGNSRKRRFSHSHQRGRFDEPHSYHFAFSLCLARQTQASKCIMAAQSRKSLP